MLHVCNNVKVVANPWVHPVCIPPKCTCSKLHIFLEFMFIVYLHMSFCTNNFLCGSVQTFGSIGCHCDQFPNSRTGHCSGHSLIEFYIRVENATTVFMTMFKMGYIQKAPDLTHHKEGFIPP